MSYEEAAMQALVAGVREGRRTSLAEAPYVKDTLGFEPDVNTLIPNSTIPKTVKVFIVFSYKVFFFLPKRTQ